MGNAASTDKPNDQPASTSPKDTVHAPRDKDSTQRRQPRRRESVPVLPHTRAAAPPAAASLENAQGHSTSQGSPISEKLQSHVTPSTHSRKRSQTSAAPGSRNDLAMTHDPAWQQSRSLGDSPHKTGAGTPTPHTGPATDASQSSPSQPRQVPDAAGSAGSSTAHIETPSDHPEPPVSPSSYQYPSSQLNRPPRLPLPIEEEILSPGSPIISPADVTGPIGKDVEGEHDLARKSSVLSSTTVDEDEIDDDFHAHGRASGQTVDTLIEWKEGGQRVYVTGSFSGWNKKHRLQKNGPSKDPNAFSTIIPLPIGAHHMTFVVDGSMQTTSHLPTAVDYTNVLINYIEISPDDVRKSTAPVDIQGRAQHQPAAPIVPMEHKPAPEPALPPPTPELKPTPRSAVPSASPSGIASSTDQQTPQAKAQSSRPAASQHTGPKRVHDTSKVYHTEIPPFLLDLDAPEQSRHFARANAVMQTQPVPPSLPMFLNKSILNGTLPMKDDASVLIMPNHTVLNHLATTSIKNHVLATSATTRYKRKYVTTIMHKPTNDKEPDRKSASSS